MRMQFCYSDTTFNFKLKSHARFSGRDRGRQLQAAEVSPFGAGRPRQKWVPARPVASGGTAAPTAREAARVVAEAKALSRCPPVGPPTGSTAAWGRAGPCAHTRTPTYTRMHTRTHAYTCTHMHTYTHARVHTHAHAAAPTPSAAPPAQAGGGGRGRGRRGRPPPPARTPRPCASPIRGPLVTLAQSPACHQVSSSVKALSGEELLPAGAQPALEPVTPALTGQRVCRRAQPLAGPRPRIVCRLTPALVPRVDLHRPV